MKIRIKSGNCPSYLTVGKEYEVVNSDEYGFYIADDDGGTRSCLFTGCGHLNGGSWEIVND